MATVFWDAEGILLVDFLENKKTITAVYYEEILRKLSKKIAEKRPGKLHRCVLFHLDNVPAHGARQTRAVLGEFRWEIIRNPPYSPDFAPSDFFLFPNLKNSLKGTQFPSVEAVKRAAMTWFKLHDSQVYTVGLTGWYQRLQKCIDLDGAYVEK
ncbi:Transposase type 1 [Trinorchestia longiramus]|nr:Transposase type 1 [Trinorchestia longiramus]